MPGTYRRARHMSALLVTALLQSTAASTAKTPATDAHAPARSRTIVSTLFIVTAQFGQGTGIQCKSAITVNRRDDRRACPAIFDARPPPDRLLFLADDTQVC